MSLELCHKVQKFKNSIVYTFLSTYFHINNDYKYNISTEESLDA